MAVTERSHRVSPLEDAELQLWAVGILAFGIGDMVTTIVGIRFRNLVEVGILTSPILDAYGLHAIVALKLLAFGLCLAMWKVVPAPYRVGVPLGIAVFGILVTLWNTLMILLTLEL